MNARGGAGSGRFAPETAGARGVGGSGGLPADWQDVDRAAAILEVAFLETLAARHRARPEFLSCAMSVAAADTGAPVGPGNRGVPGRVADQAGSGEGRPAGTAGPGHAIARPRPNSAGSPAATRRGCAAVPPTIRRSVFSAREEGDGP